MEKAYGRGAARPRDQGPDTTPLALWYGSYMDVTLPRGLVAARRTPLFDHETLPAPLATSHRAAVWAVLHVEEGDVDYADLEGESPRQVRVEAGEHIVIKPDVLHRVDPSTDARFYLQFHRAPDVLMESDLVVDDGPSPRAEGAWEHRGRDLDDADEILELVTRQYAVVVQDDLLAPYFRDVDWQGLIGAAADFWGHLLLFAPDYPIDPIERHRSVHEQRPLTGEALDRWLEIFEETVDTGWSGPNATRAKKRATGLAWAMAQRLLGKGVWRPRRHR